MQIFNTVPDLRAVIKEWRLAGESIAFVPTMGNLHAGHIDLVNKAKAFADRVVVSIFVNPTQFGVGEDFSTYPRTEQADQEKLIAAGSDALFLPAVSDVYSPDAATVITVSGISERYCGAFRPGHFSGVATVVCKLFNIVQPDNALFGLKDFQQLTVINTMVRDLNIPIEIIPVATVREESGLALSSRNGYLTALEKQVAPEIYRVLCAIKEAVLAGGQSFEELEKQGITTLEEFGFKPDYLCICRAHDLNLASDEDAELVILVAAKLGKTRLIDNIYFSRGN